MSWQVQPLGSGAGGRRHPLFFLKIFAMPWALLKRIHGFAGTSDVAAGTSAMLAKDEMELKAFPVEDIPADLRAEARAGSGISIRGLRKTYKSRLRGHSFQAVDDITLTMYQGQVTCLLGHNGAGKTSTISCLTGSTSISGGEVYINGRSIRTDLSVIQQETGVCPQKNILHDALTVYQHFTLFAGFKGLIGAEADEHIDDMLRKLEMTHKRQSLAKDLSGGQKRKLHVGLAFMADAKVVFLDEPTAGMDPYSRRSTWELIQNNRAGRVIVLTTHFMDEADILGDRVAIMAAGRVKCVGSTLFLKQLFGVGYNLTLVFNAGAAPSQAALACLACVRRHIPGADLMSVAGAEAQLQLPHDGSKGMLSLLRDLEKQKSDLGVRNYTLGATTMEEVYLRAAREYGSEPGSSHKQGKDPLASTAEGAAGEEACPPHPTLPSFNKPYAGKATRTAIRQVRALSHVRLCTRAR
ncbi:unnamed protein product, partial [Chrysoparadoxa australica]